MSRARFQPAPHSPVPLSGLAPRLRLAFPSAQPGVLSPPLTFTCSMLLQNASSKARSRGMGGEGWRERPAPRAGHPGWGRARLGRRVTPRPQTPPPTSRVPRPSGAGPGRLIHELRAECPPHPVSDCGGQTHTHRIQNDGGAELRGQAGQAGRRKRLRNGVGADGRPRHCPRRKPGSGTGRSGSGRAGLGVQADEGGG